MVRILHLIEYGWDLVSILTTLVRARGMVQSIDHPSCGPIKVISPPVKYSNVEPNIRSHPPLLGEHTTELLEGLLGMSPERIEELKRKGVVA